MHAYLELLRLPGAFRLALTSLPARLSYAMSGLAIFFHVQTLTDSLSAAGLAVGAYSGMAAATATVRGHSVDRWGQTKPLLVLVPLFTLASGLLGLLAVDPRSAIGYAALMGLTAPPINLSIRPLWKELAGPDRVRTAYALDSVILNVTQLAGPVVGTWAALQLSGPIAMYLTAGLMFGGGLLLLANPHSKQWVPEPKEAGDHNVFTSPALRILALNGLLVGFAFGLFDVGLPAAATLANMKEWAAPSLAAASLGGLIGGVIAGSYFKSWSPGRGLVLTQYLFGLGALPLFLTQPGWPTMALLFFVGIPVGMSNVYYLEVVDLVRPTGTAVAALATMWFIEGSAAAGGNAVAGILADNHGAASSLISVGVFFIAAAAIMHLNTRGVLAPAMEVDPYRTKTEAVSD